MIDFARSGRGTCRRLGPQDYRIQRDWLNEGQRRAVRHILKSPDRVILVRGAAGTGKTAMMQEAADGIQVGGTRVFAFAPSADASRGVLRNEGFENAETVARLLLDEKLQQSVRGQVIWIDGAGLLGTRVTAQVFGLIVVDASVAVKWLVPEPGEDAAARFLVDGERLVAPSLIQVEVLGAVLRKHRHESIP